MCLITSEDEGVYEYYCAPKADATPVHGTGTDIPIVGTPVVNHQRKPIFYDSYVFFKSNKF